MRDVCYHVEAPEYYIIIYASMAVLRRLECIIKMPRTGKLSKANRNQPRTFCINPLLLNVVEDEILTSSSYPLIVSRFNQYRAQAISSLKAKPKLETAGQAMPLNGIVMVINTTEHNNIIYGINLSAREKKERESQRRVFKCNMMKQHQHLCR